MTFQIGDVVEWTSSSQGYTRTKRGRVAAILPRRTRFPAVFQHGAAYNPGTSRDHESYIVLVGNRPYWPRVAALKKVSE